MRRSWTTPLIAFISLLLPATIAAAQSEMQPPASAEVDVMETLQGQMTADPDIMDTISTLQSDADFESVLEDPDVIGALESGDTAALMANPKLANLMLHPKVQEITKKLTQ